MNKKQELQDKAKREIAQINKLQPKIHKDIDAVWVFSGPGTFFTPLDKGEKPYMRWMDRHRILYGIAIACEVTAKRLNKDSRDIKEKDIATNGPLLIYNGLPSENIALHHAFETSLAFFPKNNTVIIEKITEKTGESHIIRHTQDQIKSFPTKLISAKGLIKRRIAIVSHAEHFPRILRYLKKYKTFPSHLKVQIFALTEPAEDAAYFTREEIEKVWEYYKKGDLAWDPYPVED